MNDRLAALEARLGALEDERAIRDLISSYGPLVDDGAADEVAGLWSADGVYDVDGYRMEGRGEIAEMVRSDPHRTLIARGCAHFQGPVHVTVSGDAATAAGYSLLIVHRPDGFGVARATAHHWELSRSADGWEAVARTSRALDGEEFAHALGAAAVRGESVPWPDRAG
ncbi:nuclear transport factor 2 family protein [Gordonia sp. ABSL1-1]|uniref:nuclear transport factor 2 family protein n=1 Tax=Gordonia sp. ABSL1-1 TaxID=3053923 RepID=UPI002573D2B2|nr:nuclear transport factor 2 family protein [Gordonia sp. ABSL1-1]MDL9938062.1 nuclear transport factor 2 family protein [Gordonia sp. ABSL1-1]